MDKLRKGTTKCPNDKEPLHWEQFQGMRLFRNGVYQARCPKCGTYWAVAACQEVE